MPENGQLSRNTTTDFTSRPPWLPLMLFTIAMQLAVLDACAIYVTMRYLNGH